MEAQATGAFPFPFTALNAVKLQPGEQRQQGTDQPTLSSTCQHWPSKPDLPQCTSPEHRRRGPGRNPLAQSRAPQTPSLPNTSHSPSWVSRHFDGPSDLKTALHLFKGTVGGMGRCWHLQIHFQFRIQMDESNLNIESFNAIYRGL